MEPHVRLPLWRDLRCCIISAWLKGLSTGCTSDTSPEGESKVTSAIAEMATRARNCAKKRSILPKDRKGLQAIWKRVDIEKC